MMCLGKTGGPTLLMQGYFYNTRIFIGWCILTGALTIVTKNYYSSMELLIWQMQCAWSCSYQWDQISKKKWIRGMRCCFVNR